MRQRRSWSAKTKMEMIILNLNQQLNALKKYYPNYKLSEGMLRQTIESFKIVNRSQEPG